MLPIELLQQIQAELPFRGFELDTLDAMLHLDSFEDDSLQGMRGSPTRSPAIIIYGPHQAGKTSIVKSFLTSTDEHNHTLIDCKVCVTTKSFYERCVDELLLMKISVDDDGVVTQTSTSIDNLDAFVLRLNQILESIKESNPVLVLDHFSSALFEDAADIMRATVDLFERASGTATVIFVLSDYGDLPQYPVPLISFEPYSVDELVQILQNTAPDRLDLEEMNVKNEDELKGLWDRFCRTFFSAFYEPIGQDLDLYQMIARKIFPQYLEPIKENILSAKNHVQLARAAQELLIPESWILKEESLVQSSSSTSLEKLRLNELSISSRYLLVASFLASYNPGKSDRVFFSRGKGEKTKRRGGKSAANKISKQPQRLLGPKGFTLERMLSIFQAILPMSYQHSALLDQQIATLSSRRLILKQGSGGDLLDDGKWIANLGFETVMKIAQSVNFELNRFLVSE